MIGKTQNEPILECLCIDGPCITRDNENFLISLTKDTWVFPWKTKCINIDTHVRMPDGIQGFIIGCPWTFEENVYVHPHVISDNMHVFLYMHKIGILPKRIQKGTIVARLIPVQTKQCHLSTEQIEGQS